jgi:hypothetical protein
MRIYTKRSVRDRFRDKWLPHPKTGCWVWIGGSNNKGYGVIGTHGRKTSLATRVSWELHNGPIPDGMWILHRCDHPYCVNPDHLFLGTHQDNMADQVSKGRQTIGERNGMAKLTWKTVREIRESDEKAVEIAKRLKISQVAISQIRSFQRWNKEPCNGP